MTYRASHTGRHMEENAEYEECDSGQYIHVRLSITHSLREKENSWRHQRCMPPREGQEARDHHLPYESTCFEWGRGHERYGRNLLASMCGGEMIR